MRDLIRNGEVRSAIKIDSREIRLSALNKNVNQDIRSPIYSIIIRRSKETNIAILNFAEKYLKFVILAWCWNTSNGLTRYVKDKYKYRVTYSCKCKIFNYACDKLPYVSESNNPSLSMRCTSKTNQKT